MGKRIYPEAGQLHIGVQMTVNGFSAVLFQWSTVHVFITLDSGGFVSEGSWRIVTEHKSTFETRNEAVKFGLEWAKREGVEFRRHQYTRKNNVVIFT